MEFNHKPVLLNECIDGLNINPHGIYVDGTLGGAGHSSYILKQLSKDGLLIGIDRDEDALKASKQRLAEYNNVKYIHGNHDDVAEILSDIDIEKVDGILLDLGVSSYQLDEKNRGFSYMADADLDMRMDKTQSKDAKWIINHYSEEELANIIYQYGEEKFSRKIAKEIVLERKKKEIKTTMELVDIIKKCVPFSKNGHPAKKTFQAIRIEVNNELTPLFDTVCDCIKLLKPNGRLCIITFHSLEDRIVKKAMQSMVGKCTCPPGLPYCMCGCKSYGEIVSKKAILPSEEEMQINSRSKSAKLRIFERNNNFQ